MIDEVKVYNRVLTPYEIQTAYLASRRRYDMGRVIFFRSIFGWHLVFEDCGYKSRQEYRLRIWRGYKRKRSKRKSRG